MVKVGPSWYRDSVSRPGALLVSLLVSTLASTAWAQDEELDEPPAEEGEAPEESGEAEEPEDAAPRLTPPRLIDAPAVTLPEGAEPLPEDAGIVLTILITAEGTVGEVTIETPLREDVDALVIEAAQGMRFEPATRDGEAIPARVRFRYRITPPAPPPSEEGDGTDDPEEGEPGEEGDAPPPEEVDLTDFETDDTEELGVVADVDPPEAGAAERITLQAEELTTVPGTLGEPLRVVATLPGVVRSPFGLGYFLVRGANFQNTGFFVDGFPVPILYHFAFGPAVISSRFVDRLDFYPGGYPSSLGRYSAGVVSLHTAPPPADSIRAELELDLFRASALLVVPFDDGRGSVAAAFRRSYYELLLPLFADGVNVQYTDYQLRADYRPDSRMRLSLFFFGSDDRFDQTGSFGGGSASSGVRNKLGYDFQRLIARVALRLPENARLDISGMIGRDGTFFENSLPGGGSLSFQLENINLALRVDAQVPWPGMPELQTNFGMDILAIVFGVDASTFLPPGLGRYPTPAPMLAGEAGVSQTTIRAMAALYLEQVIRLGPVEIAGAGRFDYARYGDVSEVFPDPRLVVRWRVVPELLLKAATGLFTQPPQAFQVGRTGGTPNLPPQRAWQSSFGAEITLPEDIETRFTGYYSQMYDIARTSTQTVSTPDGPRRQFFVADEQGRAYGLEVMIRRRVAQGFYGWLSYTLSRSERQIQGGRWVPFAFDQTHVLNMAASYAFDGWRFGARFQVATGRPTETITSTEFQNESADIDAFYRFSGERLQTFTRLDVRIDRDFEIGPVTGSVYLDIQNVYNAPNREGILSSYDYSQTAPLPGLPILPTIGVRGALQ